MKRKNIKTAGVLLGCSLFALSLMGCSTSGTTSTTANTTTASSTTESTTSTESDSSTSTSDSSTTTTTTTSSTTGATTLSASDLLTDRDLEQTADLTNATTLELVSGEDVTITEEGVYVVSGDVEDVTIIVEAAEDAKVQIVLDGATITNEDSPAIYVKEADKVFVTTTDSENSMEVTGTFTADGENNLDAVIYSKSDLVLNGVGTLTINSAQGNGVTSKDELAVTGGTYNITSANDALEANDGIVVNDGTFTIEAGKDGLHAENEDDATLGYIYIINGDFTITAGDDGIQATTIDQIDGGTINIKSCVEGIEGTYVLVNDGEITINASDDGINATNKSTAYDVAIELNGGTIDITMGSGDTDAVDANGDIYVNGGTINIEATSSFDSDGAAELNGGTVTVNGEVITEITQQQMGGGGQGGMGGGRMQ